MGARQVERVYLVAWVKFKQHAENKVFVWPTKEANMADGTLSLADQHKVVFSVYKTQYSIVVATIGKYSTHTPQCTPLSDECYQQHKHNT